MYAIKTLIQGSTLTPTSTVYYTTPSGTNTRIGQMSLTNTDSVSHTVSVFLVAGATTPTTADYLIKNKTLQALETFVVYQAIGSVVSAGGTIQADADASSLVVIKASGTEITQ